MTYNVTLKLDNGRQAFIRVEAPNRQEAEYRAAVEAENTHGVGVYGVLKVSKA